MENTNKISVAGRIIAILGAIFSIIMISGEWLDLYQIPMIFGDSIEHEYTLFEISEFLDEFNLYLDNSDIEFYATLLFAGAVAIIVLNVLVILLALFGTRTSSAMGGLSTAAGIIISVVFIIAVYHINAEMKEATYGAIEELLRTTSKPYWLIAFSVLTCIGCNMKKKLNNAYNVTNLAYQGHEIKQKCIRCGAEIAKDSAFCNFCGEKVTVQRQSSINSKFCTNCGAKISADATFCTECGNRN